MNIIPLTITFRLIHIYCFKNILQVIYHKLYNIVHFFNQTNSNNCRNLWEMCAQCVCVDDHQRMMSLSFIRIYFKNVFYALLINNNVITRCINRCGRVKVSILIIII